MIDPITSFAVAGNVLQFVELGIKLVKKSIEYTNAGGSQEHQNLQNLVVELSVSNAHLQSSLNQYGPDLDIPGPLRALHCANMSCLRVAKEFTDLLERLRPKGGVPLWRGMKMALRDLKHGTEIEIERLERKLNDARSNLMLSLMVHLEGRTESQYAGLSIEVHQILEEAQETNLSSIGLSSDVQRLADQMSSLAMTQNTINETLQQISSQQSSSLREITFRLNNLLAQQNEEYLLLHKNSLQLLPAVEKEILARRKVLDSLYFLQMDNRRDNISRAHGQTYSWIFRRKDNDNFVWDDFVEWLTESEDKQIYWVCGKAGSGKTTLMRELDLQITHQTSLVNWLGNKEFLQASSYFWYAGTANEKSLGGLLRNLNHQLLRQRSDLIDQVSSQDRWFAAQRHSLTVPAWTEKELKTVLTEIVKLTKSDSKILFLIDGLDEYEASDEEKEALLAFLRDLASEYSQHLKICLSSRPWNIFRDAFDAFPQLRLEDLTAKDISNVIHDTLGANKHFRTLSGKDATLLDRLSQEILNKAQGVFLWVRLVLRDLLKVLRDGGRSVHLFRELKRAPSDLDEYFMRMVNSIEELHRRDASMILQTAICSLDFMQGEEQILVSGSGLYLMDFEFLEEDVDLGFAGSPTFVLPDCLGKITAEDEMTDVMDSLDRRLNSRGMGLLEIDWKSRQNRDTRNCLLHAKVEFLHRTVRDFLVTPSAQQVLLEYTDGPFDAHLFRLSTLIARFMALSLGDRVADRFDIVPCFYHHIRARKAGDEAAMALFDKMTSVLVPQAQSMKSWAEQNLSDHDLHLIVSFFENWHDYHSSPLSLAIQFGWQDYVASRLTTYAVSAKEGRPLLDYALRPSFYFHCPINVNIINILLEKGANPNQYWTFASVWASFIFFLQAGQFHNEKALLEVLRTLVQHSASLFIPYAQLRVALGQFLFSWKTKTIIVEDPFSLSCFWDRKQASTLDREVGAGQYDKLAGACNQVLGYVIDIQNCLTSRTSTPECDIVRLLKSLQLVDPEAQPGTIKPLFSEKVAECLDSHLFPEMAKI